MSILRWAHNNLVWVPSWGSIQGAETTLVMRRGNSTDIASATVALLRAAGIPTRYVVGTVELDAPRLTNWIGGADSPQIALDLLNQGGVAAIGVVSGGRIIKVRMEHVWLQAYVNWAPSRGARQGSSTQHVNPVGPHNAWVDIDPSYKQHIFSTPIDVATAVPLDPTAVRNAVTAGAVMNTTQGFVSGIAESATIDQIRAYGQSVQAYFDSQPELQFSDLVKTREIISDTNEQLAGVLQHRVLGAQVMAALPASLRHTVTVKLFASSFDRADDSPALSQRISIAALNYRRLGVTYEPASPADAQVIDSAVAAGAASLPAYVINVRPTLKLDGTTLATGPTLRMGSAQYWTVSFEAPAGANNSDANFNNIAGDEIVFGLNGNGVTADLVAKRYVEGSPETAGGNLEQAALMYWLEHDMLDQMAANIAKVMTMRMPSVIQFAAPLTVSYFFGVARSGSYKGLSGDGQRVLVAAAGKDLSATRQFLLMAGIQGSAVEGSVLDQILSRPEETSVSTTQFFAIAMRQGLKLYSVTAENLVTALPQLAVGQSVKDDIANAVAAGFVAFVPERESVHNGYAGIGYLLLNPATGEGAYLIDGGRNGVSMPLCKSTAYAPGGVLAVQSLFEAEKVSKSIVGLTDTAGSTSAEQAAKREAAKAIEKAMKSSAERVAKRVGPRILVGLLALPPGVNVAIAVALAVVIAIEIFILVLEIKMILAELELQAVSRTETDKRCRCEVEPTDPACECKKVPFPHSPARAIPQITVYDRRVDVHHTCADASGNSYGGMDVQLTDKNGDSISVDLFSEPLQMACEVKTSFRNEPYDAFTMQRWRTKTLAQISEQKRIATSCQWSHCVIVNKAWMKSELDGLNLGYDVRLNETCGSATIPQDPFEVPSTPLD